jgi:CPA1 family monovalent cation:H+ antiporter
MHEMDVVILCGIAVVGFVCSWLAWRLRLPAILFLLFAGILAGPILGWLEPRAIFGDLLTSVVSVAVAIILFEGSLTLKLSEIRDHGTVVRNLVTIGVVITGLAGALLAWGILGWDPYLAALFGAVVTVSGPTVVMPLIRAVRPTPKVGSILRWEAILIDPLGAILALLVFDLIITVQTSAGIDHVALVFGTIVLVGVAAGAIGGYVFGLAIRSRAIPDYLRDYSALAAVLLIFAGAEYLQKESGFLAVTLMGVWLANMRGVDLADVLEFKESITLLLIGGLFILLAAELDLDKLVELGWGAIVVLVVLQFAAGPLRAFVSAIGSPLNWREAFLIGWIFPRGIVAAAVSSLFAIRLAEIDYPGADSLVPLVFSVIIGTVVIQSLTSRVVARLLGVAEPEPTGVLIVGANLLGRTLAKALADSGRAVKIADSHWASIREARMQGLKTFYGSPVSSYAEHNLELTGLGTLLAVSRQPGLNELSCVRFAEEFGRDNVFIVSNTREASHEKHFVSGESRGRVLLGGERSIDELLRLLKDGASVSNTELTDEFGYEAYVERYPTRVVLFAIDTGDSLRFPVTDETFEPAEGWQLVALTPSDAGDGR